MLSALQFNISVPTPYVFLNRFLKAAEADKHVCNPFLIHIYNGIITCMKRFTYQEASIS